MADIPDQPVARRVKDVMQRHGQLDNAEPGTEMPAGDRHGVDQLIAQFVGDLAQIGLGKLAQIGRHVDLVQERRSVGNVGIVFLIHALRSSRPAVDNESRHLS